MHLLNGGVDSRYGLASTDLSCFGFADLSSNAHGASPHVGVLEHFNSMSVGLPNPGSIHQCRIQGPVPALGSDQTRMQPSLPNSQHRHGIDPVQPVSNLSSLQHNEPFPNSDTNMIVRKRPRSPQLAEAQRLHGVRQLLSKRTGVPETSLGLICFNTQPAPKRSRTSSQKQNKEDVLNAGGSCFLCLILKKKVRVCLFPGLSRTNPSASALVNGLVNSVEPTGRNVSTIQLASRGPVTFRQS